MKNRSWLVALLAALTASLLVGAGTARAATDVKVTDNAWVGQQLSASSPDPLASYSWYACDSSGTTSGNALATATPTYTVAATDVADPYICVVDETLTGPFSDSSPPDGPIVQTPTATAVPTISGTFQQGATVTAQLGAWSPSTSDVTYQWVDCAAGGTGCEPATGPGATTASYTLVAADVGHDVEVQEIPVYDVAGGQASAAAQSANGDTVASAPAPPPAPKEPPVNSSPPTISGSPVTGQTLTASPGKWSDDPTYAYRWLRCTTRCTAIAGATSSTYQAADADVGASLAVSVTATNSAGDSASATSAHTGVVAAAATTAPTTIDLSASTATALVNQRVTLTGVVTSGVSSVDPDGTVTFYDDGAAISGCAQMPAKATGPSVSVACATSFAVSDPSLTATFTPDSGAGLASSASAAESISVAPNGSVTGLDVPSTVQRDAHVTYTASVTPALDLTGPVTPGGQVRFMDGKHTISGCAHVSLTDGGATCTTRYRDTGRQRISARYDGSSDFDGSTSRVRTVHIVRPVPRHLGSITATMQWTFHYTPTYTRILALVVHGLGAHSKVTVRCSGRGCPFHARAHTIASDTATLDLEHGFRGKRLHVDARVEVTFTRSRMVGKYYRFTIRPRRQPSVLISCLAPGSDRPGVGCTH